MVETTLLYGKPKPKGVRVDMTLKEAAALYEVLTRVGGDPKLSMRRHTDPIERSVGHALSNAGMMPELPTDVATGTIYFYPTKEHSDGS